MWISFVESYACTASALLCLAELLTSVEDDIAVFSSALLAFLKYCFVPIKFPGILLIAKAIVGAKKGLLISCTSTNIMRKLNTQIILKIIN